LDFGAYYPTEYIVIAFERHEDAAQVCQTLRDSGYSKQACSIHMGEKVAKVVQRNIDDAGFMARIGKRVAAVKKHLQKAAQQGATFLLVYAPNDDDAEGVMNAVGDKPIMLAHRYHHLVIEGLRED
jgi:hypothetical protein